MNHSTDYPCLWSANARHPKKQLPCSCLLLPVNIMMKFIFRAFGWHLFKCQPSRFCALQIKSRGNNTVWSPFSFGILFLNISLTLFCSRPPRLDTYHPHYEDDEGSKKLLISSPNNFNRVGCVSWDRPGLNHFRFGSSASAGCLLLWTNLSAQPLYHIKFSSKVQGKFINNTRGNCQIIRVHRVIPIWAKKRTSNVTDFECTYASRWKRGEELGMKAILTY